MKPLNLFFIAFGLLIFGCKDDDNVLPTPQPDTLSDEIENIIQPLVDANTAIGAAVGIIKKGGEKEMFFFGEKIKGQGEKPDENTLFEIGSITKTMTATILADMIVKGEVTLDEPVEDHLPGISNFPKFNDQKITFRHLANHTSGLPRLPDNFLDGDFDEKHPYLHYTKSKLYDFLDGYTLPRTIGSKEEYSNLGTGLLGHALGEIRHTSFESQIHEVIFDRLSLSNSFTEKPDNFPNFAQPYDEDLKAWPMWEMSDVTLGAGGVITCTKDMLTFLEANMGYGDSDLKEALALTQDNTQSLNPPFGVGLCWNNSYKAEDNTTLTWHDGGTRGTTSFIGFVKELDIGVFVVFNTEIIERTGDPLKVITTGIEIINKLKDN